MANTWQGEFPWQNLTQDGFAGRAPVGSFPQGASSDGILDLAGNVSEWTADYYGDDPPQKLSVVNPRGPG